MVIIRQEAPKTREQIEADNQMYLYEQKQRNYREEVEARKEFVSEVRYAFHNWCDVLETEGSEEIYNFSYGDSLVVKVRAYRDRYKEYALKNIECTPYDPSYSLEPSNTFDTIEHHEINLNWAIKAISLRKVDRNVPDFYMNLFMGIMKHVEIVYNSEDRIRLELSFSCDGVDGELSHEEFKVEKEAMDWYRKNRGL